MRRHFDIVGAILTKDLRDALRDSRVLVALLMPLGLGLLYSVAFGNETPKPKVKVAYVAARTTALPPAIRSAGQAAVKLTFVPAANDAAVHSLVAAKKADVGLIVPAGFDQAVVAAAARPGAPPPPLTVLLPRSSTFGGDYVAALLDQIVRGMAGQRQAVSITIEKVSPNQLSTQDVAAVIGVRKVFILISIIILLAMIAAYAVPAVLVEENEKRTMEALTMIASYPDVMAAKSLFGIIFIVVSVPIMLVVTRGAPVQVAGFVAATVLTAVTLVGLGLMFAGFMRSQTQLNSWSSVLMLPLLAPAFTVGLSTPPAVNAVLFVLPTSQTMRLLVNAFAGRDLFGDAWLSYLILAAWAVAAYSVLWWQLDRRRTA